MFRNKSVSRRNNIFVHLWLQKSLRSPSVIINSLNNEIEVEVKWDGDACHPFTSQQKKKNRDKNLPRKRQKRSRKTRIFLWLVSFPSLLGFMLSEAITFSQSKRCIDFNLFLPFKTEMKDHSYRLLSAWRHADAYYWLLKWDINSVIKDSDCGGRALKSEAQLQQRLFTDSLSFTLLPLHTNHSCLRYNHTHTQCSSLPPSSK